MTNLHCNIYILTRISFGTENKNLIQHNNNDTNLHSNIYINISIYILTIILFGTENKNKIYLQDIIFESKSYVV